MVSLCFGSNGRFSKEIALWLEKSEQRFLWVVRSDDESHKESLEELLLEGFLERTKEKGMVNNGQMSNYFGLQGSQMNTHVGNSKFQIPPPSISIFDTLSVIFWVPVYDRIIVPIARKFSGHKNGLTQLQRMGIGHFISIFSMVAAATLEYIRLRMVRRHNYYELEEVLISIFWQVPQYFIIGCAKVFTFIGQLEFFYEQAPDSMRSLCSALSLLTVALGQYLSSLLITIVKKITTRKGGPGWLPNNLNYGHLDYFFWLLVVLNVLNLIAFLVVSKFYTYKKTIETLH
ncbi:hypothetical protein RIF29_29336 [Crotalaria pallida]|uniref:Uncharacterized protein n=1 Tax=Crotalaria pallida TaxID=3830 RepID=A0AAN9HTU3_CROPI